VEQMKHYDVFKSQGGYGVALGIYLDSPVMGSIRWFKKEEEAEEYAKNKQAYDKAYAQFEDSLQYMGSDEIEKAKAPTEEDYNLNVGITI